MVRSGLRQKQHCETATGCPRCSGEGPAPRAQQDHHGRPHCRHRRRSSPGLQRTRRPRIMGDDAGRVRLMRPGRASRPALDESQASAGFVDAIRKKARQTSIIASSRTPEIHEGVCHAQPFTTQLFETRPRPVPGPAQSSPLPAPSPRARPRRQRHRPRRRGRHQRPRPVHIDEFARDDGRAGHLPDRPRRRCSRRAAEDQAAGGNTPKCCAGHPQGPGGQGPRRRLDRHAATTGTR